MNKLLIAIPSPRDIPEVQDNWTTYNHDVIVYKYGFQKEAYQYLRKYFLDHNEYTHFCIMPDDLVVSSEQLDRIWHKVDTKHFKVLSGLCPVDEDETRPAGIPMALQKTVQDTDGTSPREWIFKHEIDFTQEYLSVEHVGFSCTIIDRDVLSHVCWRGATKLNIDLEGNFDWEFSKDIKRLGLHHTVLTSVVMQHLRNRQNREAKENPKNKESFVYFIKDNSSTKQITTL